MNGFDWIDTFPNICFYFYSLLCSECFDKLQVFSYLIGRLFDFYFVGLLDLISLLMDQKLLLFLCYWVSYDSVNGCGVNGFDWIDMFADLCFLFGYC